MSGRPPGKPDLSSYNYDAISSLVLTTGRSVLPRRDKEPNGAPTSLVGRIDLKEMVSRDIRAQPKDMDKKKKKALAAAAEAQQQDERREKGRRGGGLDSVFGNTDIIESTAGVEGLTYRPKTAETREVYELMLASVHTALGDQAQDIVRSATDAVLEVLKREDLKDFDKKREVETVLGTVSGEQFSQLLSLAKKITDYTGDGDEEMGVDPDMERKDGEIDDEVGVAVVFDEEVQEEEEEEGYEVRDESSDDDDEENDEDEDEEMEKEDGDEGLVIGGEDRDKGRKVHKDIISPHAIDGFWVQRHISEIYPDPVTAVDKASSVLSILGSESSLRDCENQLMELFDYQNPHITQVFVKNRDALVYCTKLRRSDTDDR